MKNIDATFDEAVDGFSPVAEGTYPAHCSEFGVNDWKDSKIFNLTFTIATEAKTLNIPKLASDGNGGFVQQVDSDNKPITVAGDYMVGKKFKNNGVWLTPKPKAGESWKNRRYKEFFEALGVDFPSEGGKVALAEVEESDVVGLPCLVDVKQQSFKNKEGEERTAMKVTSVFPWNDGTRLSMDELSSDDVPF
jgi:hypothetical protein